MIPIFRYYTELKKHLPYVQLGNFPTSIEKLDKIGNEFGLKNLYIKRDDLSGESYGGNKVRKLEFLFGKVLQTKSKHVITLGFAGSNHALASAIYAKKLGLKCSAMLMPQNNAYYVRRNLLAGHYYESKLHYYKNFFSLTLAILKKSFKTRIQQGYFSEFIPAGGSCPLGVIGYVNAAFELKEQILSGIMPEPDYIYVPLGSTGTSTGLALGLKAAGLKTEVVAVRVIENYISPFKGVVRLLEQTNLFLRKNDPGFPEIKFKDVLFSIKEDDLGSGYAHFTENGIKAADIMKKNYGIILNGAYSAKAFASLLSDAEKNNLNDKVVLFWNTYNSRDLSEITSLVNYLELPKEFHRYFEEDVQSLDTGLDC
ncbi:MAG: hypothetical protein ACD_79C01221G0003 [uncultured bacterium]|nr:MAG: hypothetical protein ACD_79C01221G0003 [uncultured bacterium]